MAEMAAKMATSEGKMEKHGLGIGRMVLLAAAVVGLVLRGRELAARAARGRIDTQGEHAC